MDGLLALAERCEAASGADRELDAEICVAVGIEPQAREMLQFPAYDRCIRYYTASLDAAMTLVPERYKIVLSTNNEGKATAMVNAPDKPRPAHLPKGATYFDGPRQDGFAKNCSTPALALTAAALRARAQKVR